MAVIHIAHGVYLELVFARLRVQTRTHFAPSEGRKVALGEDVWNSGVASYVAVDAPTVPPGITALRILKLRNLLHFKMYLPTKTTTT